MSLHDAVADISSGRIDYALVLGSCLILAPNMTLAFNRLHMLAPDGACKAFDASGNGQASSLVASKQMVPNLLPKSLINNLSLELQSSDYDLLHWHTLGLSSSL